MEIEWRWNGKNKDRSSRIKYRWNGMEREKKIEWKKWVNNDFVKWIWKWNGMEMETRWKKL